MEDFRNRVNDMELVDLPLLGRKITWYRNNQASRIDRVFLDGFWLENFRDIKLLGLNRSISDHCPLLIECESENRGPKPFKNLDVWFTNPRFKKLVEHEWKNLHSLPFQEKLKRLKEPINVWNKKVFGNIS